MKTPPKRPHRFVFRWDRKRQIIQLTAFGTVAVISAYGAMILVFVLWRYLR